MALASYQRGSGRWPVQRQPPFDCNTASELDCRDNELGYMFYHNLGGTFDSSIVTSTDPDLALFPTLQDPIWLQHSHNYWTGTAFDSSDAWEFYFGDGGGGQGTDFKTDTRYNWAVHPGNVGAVPVLAAVWVFSSGLLGLVGVARKKATR